MIAGAAQRLALRAGQHPTRGRQGQRIFSSAPQVSPRATVSIRWLALRATARAILSSILVGFTVKRDIDPLMIKKDSYNARRFSGCQAFASRNSHQSRSLTDISRSLATYIGSIAAFLASLSFIRRCGRFDRATPQTIFRSAC